MYIIIIPLVFLLVIAIFKKIPKIGGNLVIAMVGAGLLALLLGKVYNPLQWVSAWFTGLDSLAWILWLILIGGIFSCVQQELGAMETVLDLFRALLGKTTKGLVLAVLISLYIGGALIGSTTAVGAVVGVLVVPTLASLGLSAELICAIIVIGASMGSIMPPISQAVTLSASLMNMDPTPAINVTYITVGIGLIIISIFVLKFFIKDSNKIPEDLLPKESAGEILAKRWKSLIPIIILLVLVLCKSIPAIGIDIPTKLLNLIVIGGTPLTKIISGVPILGKITNNIVMSLLFSTIISFIIFKSVRKSAKKILVDGSKSVIGVILIQFAAGFMLGGFKAGGQITMVTEYATALSATALKIGGGGALTASGMLLGAQSTAQNTVFTIVGPAWLAAGVEPVNTIIAGSHLAAAGQGLPPADLNTFAIAGLVGAILHKKVDPLKSMFYSSCFCIYLLIVGMAALFI
jgi:TRAP-type C4-dicarboxylate transport system permease large subunit